MNITKELMQIDKEIAAMESKKKEIIKKINVLFLAGSDDDVERLWEEMLKIDDEITRQGMTRNYLQSLH